MRTVQLTGLPKNIWMKRMTCCQAVNRLRSIVARPVTVAEVTQRKRASTYAMWFSPLEAYRIMEKKRGTKVLRRVSTRVATEPKWVS